MNNKSRQNYLNPYLTNNDPNFQKNWIPSNEFIFQPLQRTNPLLFKKKKYVNLQLPRPTPKVTKIAKTPESVTTARRPNKYLDSLDPVLNRNNLWDFRELEVGSDEIKKFKKPEKAKEKKSYTYVDQMKSIRTYYLVMLS